MTFQIPEPFTVPEGGLATFLTATRGSWADEDTAPVPVGGISNISYAADQLAQFGRNGDTYMVHAAEGETFVPKEVLDANPGLKESLFSQMRSMGIENPERYIVGSDLNSLNPVTGQPEFFLSKIFKSVKNIVKGVVKVVKKAAPYILPVVLSTVMPPATFGSILPGALGSGIGSLLKGKSLKDSLKAAALGGITTGAFRGVQNVMADKGFFTDLLPKFGQQSAGVEKLLTSTPTGDAYGESTSVAFDSDDPFAFSNVRGVGKRLPVTVRELDTTALAKNPFREGSLAYHNFEQEFRNPFMEGVSKGELRRVQALRRIKDYPTAPYGDTYPDIPSLTQQGDMYSGIPSLTTPQKSASFWKQFNPMGTAHAGETQRLYTQAPTGKEKYLDNIKQMVQNDKNWRANLSTKGVRPKVVLTESVRPKPGGIGGMAWDRKYAGNYDPKTGAVLEDMYLGEGYVNDPDAFGPNASTGSSNIDFRENVPSKYGDFHPVKAGVPGTTTTGTTVVPKPADDFFTRLRKYLLPSKNEILDRQIEAAQRRVKYLESKGINISDKAKQDYFMKVASSDPTFWDQYGNVLMGAVPAVMAAAKPLGLYDAPTITGGGGTGMTQAQVNAAYNKMAAARRGIPTLRSGPRQGFTTALPVRSATGGEMYPERIGAISGEGTGVSDDVPALLSDGEFVMTARAVRGAGNGSRRKGVRRMYDLMRKFEGETV